MIADGKAPFQQTLRAALESIQGGEDTYRKFLAGNVGEVGFYQPVGTDPQAPQDRDKIHVVAAGKGKFFVNGTTRAVAAGDLLFVPAGAEHRFIEFSGDFATWVIFFGKG